MTYDGYASAFFLRGVLARAVFGLAFFAGAFAAADFAAGSFVAGRLRVNRLLGPFSARVLSRFRAYSNVISSDGRAFRQRGVRHAVGSRRDRSGRPSAGPARWSPARHRTP